MKFDELKEGLHSPPTRIKLETRQQAFGTTWEGFVIHEVIYVNKSDKEVVYQAFSSINVMTADQFNTRGYLREERVK